VENLRNLLERFSRSLDRNTAAKEAVISAVSNHTKISLSPKDISIRDGVLEITASAVAKSEINLKTRLILAELKAQKVPVERIVFR
jgi:hypothetical protein